MFSERIAILAVLTFSSLALASDWNENDFEEPSHLVPDQSVFAEPFLMDYYLMVSDLLPPKEMEVVRALVFPPFSPESAVSIVDIKENYTVEARQPVRSYWAYKTLEHKKSGGSKILKDGQFVKDHEGIEALEKELPEDPSELEVKSCSKKISRKLAKEIASIWKRELSRVKYPSKDWGGFDGATYHFSMRRGLLTLAGQTWSPSKKLPTGELVAIVNSLHDYCFGEASIEEVSSATSAAR